MKTIFRYLAVTLLVVGLAAPSFGFDKSRQVGVSFSGGLMNSAHGGFFHPTHSMSDVLDNGTNFSFGVSYGLTEVFRLEALVDFSFASFNEEFEAGVGPDPTYPIPEDPTYAMWGFKLQSVTHLNPVLGTGESISPFVTFGMGIYSFEINDDGITGDRIPSPQNRLKDVSKTAFGLNAGLGVEFYVTPSMAIAAKGKYDLVLADDGVRFGPDFRDQGFFSLDLGFNFYFTMF